MLLTVGVSHRADASAAGAAGMPEQERWYLRGDTGISIGQEGRALQTAEECVGMLAHPTVIQIQTVSELGF
jgi:hypothetical protein